MQFKKYRDRFVGMAFLDCSFPSIPCPPSTEKLRDRISSPISGVRTQSSITQSPGLSLSLESKEIRRGKSLLSPLPLPNYTDAKGMTRTKFLFEDRHLHWVPTAGLPHQASTWGFLNVFPFTTLFTWEIFMWFPNIQAYKIDTQIKHSPIIIIHHKKLF